MRRDITDVVYMKKGGMKYILGSIKRKHTGKENMKRREWGKMWE